MQKRASFVVLTLGFLLVLAMSASAQTRVRAEYAVPPDARLEEYPLLPFMSAQKLNSEMANKGLFLAITRFPWTGYNHHREMGKSGRWVLETLPVGTFVYTDREGRVLYKADCANRLVWSGHTCPTCPPIAAAGDNGQGGATAVPPAPRRGFIRRIGDGLWAGVKGLYGAIGSGIAAVGRFVGDGLYALLPFLLLLLPFALAGALGYWLATRRHGGPPAGGGAAPGGGRRFFPGRGAAPVTGAAAAGAVAGGAAGAALGPRPAPAPAAPMAAVPGAAAAAPVAGALALAPGAAADAIAGVEFGDDGEITLDPGNFRRVTIRPRHDGRMTFRFFPRR